MGASGPQRSLRGGGSVAVGRRTLLAAPQASRPKEEGRSVRPCFPVTLGGNFLVTCHKRQGVSSLVIPCVLFNCGSGRILVNGKQFFQSRFW